MALSAEAAREAYRRVNGWRADPATPVACPVCETSGLSIEDRSARPYAEWYALSCTACGLRETLNVPMSAPVRSLD